MFGGTGPIDVGEARLMHLAPGGQGQCGGSIRWVSGDLMDAHVCPGPFDVVIERRTVQLFPDGEQPAALERLAARLAPRGTFVTHEHCGAGRPGRPRTHYAEAWLRAHGFIVGSGAERPDGETADRLALLVYTTG